MMVAAAALTCVPASGRSQGATAPPVGGVRSVSGHMYVARGAARRPAVNVWVTLHRIGHDLAAPLDSVNVGASGAFAFRYRQTGDTSAVYILTGQHGGIAYFSAPLREANVAGGAADLIAYDTASTGVPITIASRHVIVSAADEKAHRTIIEVVVVANGGDLTRVATAASPSFTARLPVGAADPRVSDGEVSADAMTFAGGTVRVTAPIAPGTKRIAFTYTLPARAPIMVASTDTTAALEVLVEDSAVVVTGSMVHEDAPASVSGRTFRRFSGQKVATTDGLTITALSGTPSGIGAPGVLALVLAAAMTTVLAITVRRGAPIGAPRRVRAEPTEAPASLAPPGEAA